MAPARRMARSRPPGPPRNLAGPLSPGPTWTRRPQKRRQRECLYLAHSRPDCVNFPSSGNARRGETFERAELGRRADARTIIALPLLLAPLGLWRAGGAEVPVKKPLNNTTSASIRAPTGDNGMLRACPGECGPDARREVCTVQPGECAPTNSPFFPRSKLVLRARTLSAKISDRDGCHLIYESEKRGLLFSPVLTNRTALHE